MKTYIFTYIKTNIHCLEPKWYEWSLFISFEDCFKRTKLSFRWPVKPGQLNQDTPIWDPNFLIHNMHSLHLPLFALERCYCNDRRRKKRKRIILWQLVYQPAIHYTVVTRSLSIIHRQRLHYHSNADPMAWDETFYINNHQIFFIIYAGSSHLELLEIIYALFGYSGFHLETIPIH